MSSLSTSSPSARSVSSIPTLDHIKDPNVHGNRNFWSAYDWPEGGDEWSKPFGNSSNMWYGSIYPRLRALLPARHILEIAPGFGRITQFLHRYCQKLTIIDLVPKCIEACQMRFAQETHITYHVNDGRSLAMIEDQSVDLVVSWDSLVHVEHETIREYLQQLAVKLRPGGYGFIHHSNLGMQYHTIAHEPDKHVLGGRRPSMTAEKFRNDCMESGLWCLSQELIPWTEPGLFCDSFSFFMRPHTRENQQTPTTTIVERPDWGQEVKTAAHIGRMYQPLEAVSL